MKPERPSKAVYALELPKAVTGLSYRRPPAMVRADAASRLRRGLRRLPGQTSGLSLRPRRAKAATPACRH